MVLSVMSAQTYRSLGELKQALTRDYNKINSRLFSNGVVTLKIEIVEDKILMLALHKRVMALSLLSQEAGIVADLADYYLIKVFKKHMKEVLEKEYGFEVTSIFKDYDSVDELSMTLILLKQDVQKYLS